MTADDHLRAGDIDAARAALVDAVRRSPADQAARMFLFQLLLVCGEWHKASAQLKALAQLSPEAQMLATVYNQAIEAEKARIAAFAGHGAFPVLLGDEPWMVDLALALQAFAEGRADVGEDRREAAFSAAPESPGTVDGRPFAWIADADGRFGPATEMILYGRWGLVPFAAVEDITFEGPTDLRDVVWLPVQLRLRSGQSAAAFIPARYPGSESDADPLVRLGRSTTWREGPGGEAPIGQRLWSFDDGAESGVLAVKRLDFA